MRAEPDQDLPTIDPIAAYDALAPCYKAISASRRAYLLGVEKIIVAHIPGALSLLDIGAGDGVRSLRIAKAAKIPHTVVVEPSARMRAGYPKYLHAWACKATELPESGSKFDVITCLWNVLGHLPTASERVVALSRARRLLSPRGVMFVDVNHRYNAASYGWLSTLYRLVCDGLAWSEHNGDVPVSWTVDGRRILTRGHLFTPGELAKLFQASGLRVCDCWVLDYQNGSRRRFSFLGNLLYRLAIGET